MANYLRRTRRHDCTRSIPSATDAVADGSERYSGSIAPLRNRQRLACVRQAPVAARVVLLLLGGRPSDVAWFVIAVVVTAINGVDRRRTRPYVLSEQIKRVAPTRADGDSSSAVFGITRVVGVEATLLHARPRLVEVGASDARCALFNGGVHASASTGLDSRPQATLPERDYRAAVALALKDAASVAGALCSLAKHHEHSETSAGRFWLPVRHQQIVAPKSVAWAA